MKATKYLSTAAVLFFSATAAVAQTGKIAGRVVEADGGAAIPGVNVAIEGTTQGTVTDVDGYYAILNVRPGTYALRASFVGYTPVVSRNVEVFVDLTTDINTVLSKAIIEGEEVIVTMLRPVVRRDVSASVANINSDEFKNLPITDLDKIVGLQAGFERNLTVRGFGGDQVQWLVDGYSMASGLHNEPFVAVSVTAVQETHVQTGGFNAEYGNVRSGLVNVITKEPDRSRYSVDAIVRYSPASRNAFAGTDVDGQNVDGPDSKLTFDLRPMFDPEVAMDGVNSWPSWKRDEYRTWSGWNFLATNYNRLNGTRLTGRDLQSVFEQHYLRKEMEVTTPDYEIDATLGGPVPALSDALGDLRFLISYRREQQAYPISGYARDAYTRQVAQGKLISTLAPGMKLVFKAHYGAEDGLNGTPRGGAQQLMTREEIQYPWQGNTTSMYFATDLDRLLTDAAFYLMDVDRLMLGAKFTHALNARTFYEVQLQSMRTDYSTRTIGTRDETDLNFSYLDGQIRLDRAPFGCTRTFSQDVVGIGISMGPCGGFHDSSSIRRFAGRFDLTSQVNRFTLLKTGAEYIYSDFDIDYGDFQPWTHFWQQWTWRRQPQQAAAYAHSKLEFKGMIANIGLRMDYFDAGGNWYVHADFDRAFTAAVGLDRLDEVLEREPTKRLVSLSPRLGVSFPVTNHSKLYFNYGHFRTMPDPVALFTTSKTYSGAIVGIGDPNSPLPRTIAYELGFEQSLLGQFHFRLAGYSRDLSKDPRDVRFIGKFDQVDYVVPRPWDYADVRGFEATLTRTSGAWVRGFVNYTYMVRKTGGFGFSRFDENPTAMASFVTGTTEHYVSKPIPEPYARLNLEVLLPDHLGPRVRNTHLLGDWRITFVGEWRRGQTLTWNGQSLGPAAGGGNDRVVQGNVRWRDYYMLDMRLSKNFATSFGRAHFFVDFANVLNLRHLYFFEGVFGSDVTDMQRYMQSLHLPVDAFPEGFGGDYPRIFGDDQPGDFRGPGVPYVPINVGSLPAEVDGTRPLYYVPDEDTYYQWTCRIASITCAFLAADEGYVEQVLRDKAYINMPNLTWGTFLNPRNVFFGVRLSF